MVVDQTNPDDILHRNRVLDEWVIEYLEAKFPPSQPRPVGTEREDLYLAGIAKAIAVLRDARQYQIDLASGIQQELP